MSPPPLVSRARHRQPAVRCLWATLKPRMQREPSQRSCADHTRQLILLTDGETHVTQATFTVDDGAKGDVEGAGKTVQPCLVNLVAPVVHHTYRRWRCISQERWGYRGGESASLYTLSHTLQWPWGVRYACDSAWPCVSELGLTAFLARTTTL